MSLLIEPSPVKFDIFPEIALLISSAVGSGASMRKIIYTSRLTIKAKKPPFIMEVL